MGTDRAHLERFLGQHLRSEGEVRGIMDRLRPFYENAEARRYELTAAETLGADDIRLTLASAAACPVSSVAVLSSSAMTGTMSATERSVHLARSGVTIRDGLWIRIMREHATALDAALSGRDLRQPLFAAFHRSVGAELRAVFEERYRPVIGRMHWLNTTSALGDVLLLGGWNGIQESLLYWLGFSLAGDAARAARLAPLVELMLRAVPLCESERSPGTWIVLAG